VTQLNASVTLGTGDVIGTQLINSKEVQGVLILNDSGHISHTLPTYYWYVPPAVSAVSKLMADIFNPAASGKIIDILGLWCIPKSDVAVAPVIGVEFMLFRTSAAGTGGTAYTYNGGTVDTAHTITPLDTANTTTLTTSLVTARAVPTAGATISAMYFPSYSFSEETNAAAYIGSLTNLLPMAGEAPQPITLNSSEGLLIKEGTAATPIGSFAFLGLITVV
jgi:hypothetical protein